MYAISDFNGALKITVAQYLGAGHPETTLVAELNAITTALGTDPTTYDVTIQFPPAAVLPGWGQTPFTNDVLLLVNTAKGGGNLPTAIAAAISAALSTIMPPQNTTLPLIGGTGTVGQTLACNTGTWLYSPTLAYQWLRDGTPVAGATTSSYLLVAADSTHSLSCIVTGTNPAGSASVTSSNSIAVT